MKISYNWLKQFVKTDWDAAQAGELLTDLGLEVEGIETFESIPGGLKGLVVGEVKSCEQHPNADRLKLTKVDVGQEELLSPSTNLSALIASLKALPPRFPQILLP